MYGSIFRISTLKRPRLIYNYDMVHNDSLRDICNRFSGRTVAKIELANLKPDWSGDTAVTIRFTDESAMAFIVDKIEFSGENPPWHMSWFSNEAFKIFADVLNQLRD